MSWEDIGHMPAEEFSGPISKATRLSNLEAIARGLRTAIRKMGGPCQNATALLASAEERIGEIKNPDYKPKPVQPSGNFPDVASVMAKAIVTGKITDPAEEEIEIPF